jgi:lipoprotein-anchoring transpeptidase ErfK/SrfK
MKGLRKHLISIFYFPLVILVFTLVFINAGSIYFSLKGTQPELILGSGSFNPNQKQAYFNQKDVAAPTSPFLMVGGKQEGPAVLSASTGEKWIDINLTTQTLTAFEPDGGVFMQVPISSGLWGRTPAGTYRIWIKLRYTLMHGGSQALGTYYYLPNVPCTQYFYNGYGLHGTYWHNNFGHPMSHGCINMYTPDACKLFEWTSPPISSDQSSVRPTADNPGTKVVTHY